MKYVDDFSKYESNKRCVVVDDLIDSGKTKEKFKDNDFYVLFDKRDMKSRVWIEFF